MKIFEPAVVERLLDARRAFDSKVTTYILLGIIVALALSALIVFVGSRTNRFSAEVQSELRARLRSWIVLVLIIATPILLGAAFTIVAVWGLGLLCVREYAKTVGIWQHKLLVSIVIACISVLAFASLDHFDRLYFATSSLGVGLIVVCSVIEDQPKGFIQRVALGVFGFLLFGYSLSYLGLIANAPFYRPLLLSIVLAVEANDVFAYCCGKFWKGPKLIPKTSPGKTRSGAIGAVVLTSGLVAVLFHFIFAGTAIDHVWILLLLGALVSVVGQLGDLTLSAIKRDIGIKDFGVLIPGHGGLLDRFDSLVLVPPVVYHFLSLFLGPLGADQPIRVISGL